MILVPLTDVSRRPTRLPVVTGAIIVVNVLMCSESPFAQSE
jgi:hypothetical protein